MDLQQFVIPIYRSIGSRPSWAGTGFLIDGHLITAGHVVTDYQPYYALIDRQFVTLEPGLWSPTLLPSADKLEYDVTIYPMPGVKSALTLATDDISSHAEVDVLCWQWREGGVRRVATRGVTLGDAPEDGYLLMATVDHITNGCSGCPVLIGTEVVGIVTMVKVPDPSKPAPPGLRSLMDANTCWVFKADHIRRFFPAT